MALFGPFTDKVGPVVPAAMMNLLDAIQQAITANSVTKVVTIGPPTAGTTLTLNATGGTSALDLVAAAGSWTQFTLQDGQAGTRKWRLAVGATGVGILDINDLTRNATILQIDGTGKWLVFPAASGVTLTVNGTALFSAASGAVTVDSSTAANAPNLFFTLNGANKGRLGVEGTAGVTITGSAAGDVYWYSNGGAFLFSTNGAAAAVRVAGSAIQFPGVGTTASAANAFLDNTSSNNLLRSTSSLRYKTGVEDMWTSLADNVLKLRPIWYRSKADADRKDWSWFGLAAEEVAQIEPRLVHWSFPQIGEEEKEIDNVNFQPAIVDEEGKVVTEAVGQPKITVTVPKFDTVLAPDAVQYERVAVLLLSVVQRLCAALKKAGIYDAASSEASAGAAVGSTGSGGLGGGALGTGGVTA